MAVDTFDDFVYLYDIPYTIVIIAYLVLKYIVIIAVAIERIKKCRCNCWDTFAKPWRIYTSWAIRIIFGGSEGVSENKHSLETAEHGGEKVYINKVEVKKANLDILGAIITCFFLLVMLTMYSSYLLEVTFQCSEDPAHYCFARTANFDESKLIDRNQRIENCSDYDKLLLSSNSPLTIECFRYALNAKEALAIGGGLLAIFTIAMRVTISLISKIWNKTSKYCNAKLNRALQVTAFFILTAFNLVATIIVAVFAVGGRLESLESEDAPIAQRVAAYLADNGVQFIIVLSTVELLLLIDWKEFAPSAEAQNENIEME